MRPGLDGLFYPLTLFINVCPFRVSALPPKSVSPLPGLHLRGMGRPLPLAQIVRFEADDNYTRVYVRGYRWPLLYAYTLGVMCQRFPAMARVARSVAINPGYLKAVTKQGIWLRDQPVIRLSNHYLKRLPSELRRARQVAGRQRTTDK